MTKLVALKREPTPGVVRCLEEMLKAAKAGDIFSIAIAAQGDDASTVTAFDNSEGDVAHMVCALERLKLRLLLDE
ncbi:hypothetical protein LCGC14_1509610 [marine sediment metagenome]|uniref:Uncharacterized protein n=1 Tax=marine sediment metagenome TaxID=412755 RepID=A0A0F9JMH6_9ZZZZ